MESNETFENHAAGAVIFREGEKGDRAYVIEAGFLEISTCFQGDKLILSLLGPGEIVGEMAIVDDAPRAATATVVADCKLRVIHREQLHQRLHQADPILNMLMRLITARYRSSASMIGKLSDARDVANDRGLEQVTDGAVDKIRMEGELRSAIENRSLTVAYQPIVDLHSGRVVGFEALARWQHPREGFVPPQRFVALAEETNLIRGIDEFVFREAVEGIQRIDDRIGTDGDLFVGVNVSGRHLSDRDFLDTARGLTRSVGLNPESVKLELTESHIAEREKAESWINAAKGHGFRVAIDDFGTGFSSLSQLLRLDVDTVKIDRSFVSKLGKVEMSGKMLQGLIDLAKSINLAVIIEGVETEYQRYLLGELGCQVGQGFFWGNPMPLEEILANSSFKRGTRPLCRG